MGSSRQKHFPDLFRILHLTFTIFLLSVLFPSALSGVDSGRFKQHLSWTSDENAFEYRVEIRTLGTATEVEGLSSAQSGAGNTGKGKSTFFETEDNYIDLTLSAGNYEFRVYAYDFLGRESSVTEWKQISVIRGQTPKIQDLQQNVVVSENNKVTFDIPLDVSSITRNTTVELVNIDTQESIQGELKITEQNGEIIASSAVFPEVSEGNWKAKVTNPSGLYTETEEIAVAKSVAQAEEIARTEPGKKFVESETVKAEKLAEEQRQAELAAAEEKRLAEEKAAEEARLAQEEADRLAEEQRQIELAAAEAKRIEDAKNAEADQIAKAQELHNQKVSEAMENASLKVDELSARLSALETEKTHLADIRADTQKKYEDAQKNSSPVMQKYVESELNLVDNREKFLDDSIRFAQIALADAKELEKAANFKKQADESGLWSTSQTSFAMGESALENLNNALQQFDEVEQIRGVSEKNAADTKNQILWDEKTYIESETKARSELQAKTEKEISDEKILAAAEDKTTKIAEKKINDFEKTTQKVTESLEKQIQTLGDENVPENQKQYVAQKTEILEQRKALAQKAIDSQNRLSELRETSSALKQELVEKSDTLNWKDYEDLKARIAQADEQTKAAEVEYNQIKEECARGDRPLANKESSLDKSIKKAADFNLLLGANAMFDLYDGSLLDYVDWPLSVEANLKLEWYPIKAGNERIGFSLGTKPSDLYFSNDLITYHLPVLLNQLNIEYQHPLITDHLYLNGHAGAGLAILGDYVEYSGDSLREENDFSLHGYICAQAGVDLYWQAAKHFVIETGADMTYIFIPDMPTLLAEPYILFGLRL